MPAERAPAIATSTPGADLPISLRRAYADTAVGRLHYAEAGSGRPLILMHQTPRSHDEFADVLPLLATQHRAIAMDMVGFGHSAPLASPQTIEQYAAGVVALADALGLERFAVLGHHTGAVVAIEVAASVPTRVDAAVLSSPAFTDAAFREAHAGGAGVDAADRDDSGGHLTAWWGQRAPYYPAHRPDLLDRFIRDCLAPGVDPAEGHLACARYRMEDRIGLVVAPVLVLGADADPFAFPQVTTVAEALRGAARVAVRVIGGGTIPLMEHMPVAVAEAVNGFTASLGTHPA